MALWSRENRKNLVQYVDLFEDVPSEYEDEFKKWDQRLNNADWKHKFLDLQHEAVKNQTVASDFDSQGNVHFERTEFHKAMELYNQALCFAEMDSQKGLLYAKRALCFFNLYMYAECIADTKLALNTELPFEWKSKMNEYQEKGTKLLSTTEYRKPIAPKLSFDADTTFPCMANVVQINKNGLETNIVAKSDIGIGQTVLLERAFTSIAVGYDTAVCFTCFKMCTNLMPCADCTDVMFCSEECMRLSDVHKISCGNNYSRMPSYIKLVVQSILEALTTFSSDYLQLMAFVNATVSRKVTETNTDARILNYGQFFGLKSSSKPLPIQLIYEAYTTAMAIPVIQKMFITEKSKRFLMHLVGHHVQVLLANSYGGFEKDQNQFIFASMTNVASLFQHSCTPNLMQHTIGNQTILITNQPVKQGDRLYIDYIPQEHEAEQRIVTLIKDFGIVCTCAKCNPPHPMIDSNLQNDSSFELISQYTKYIPAGIPATLKQKCVEFLQQHAEKPWSEEKELVINVYSQCLLAELDNQMISV
ncbi:SET and MYND domain-containing protein DDB_G0273589-like [Sitodiplosis mosellana]|uniref:SET and MYND domain-containing protein DDB_G0273589-like n=1 Tax=Sitodiplosis mosellana TaxID=263140 RepID=UPI002443F168|nr:SET and MYND domain-containing protein DDB_G0273589-like [Sitodiplosis mosellana]